MDPRIWGPPLWKSVHYIALGYPENPTEIDKQRFKIFFTNLHHVIPCQKCSDHYRKHMSSIPIEPYLSDSGDLFAWTVKMHNKVNVLNGKKEWSFEKAYNQYSEKSSNILKLAGSMSNIQVGSMWVLMTVVLILATVYCDRKYLRVKR